MPGREASWESKRGTERLIETIVGIGLPVRVMGEDEATEAWSRIAAKALAKTGVDLVRSESQYVWDDLGPHAETISRSLPLLSPTSSFALLLEGHPRIGVLIDAPTLQLDRFERLFDVCLVPWPRVGWLALLPHEESIGPYLLDLRPSTP